MFEVEEFVILGFSNKGMQAHVVSLVNNKRSMLCKYTSGIYMAK